MIRYYCDHCGDVLTGAYNELDYDDTFMDPTTYRHLGIDCLLCDECYEERERLHLELDKQFLHLTDTAE